VLCLLQVHPDQQDSQVDVVTTAVLASRELLVQRVLPVLAALMVASVQLVS